MKSIALVLLFSFIAVISWGDVHEAASASEADVTTAIGLASTGDTVTIPSGEETWTELALNKEITLEGAGIGNTIINGSGTTDIMVVTPTADNVLRITGIEFRFATNNSGGRSITLNGSEDSSFCLSSLRIDHCKFVKGSAAINPHGWIEGVIDNNYFLNNNISIRIEGDDEDQSWLRTIAAGTSHALFIESNEFVINADTDREPNQLIYHQEGARTVIRYNILDARAYTAGNGLWFDSHGNWPYYGEGDSNRGQPIIEVYENLLRFYQTNRVFYVRGGSILIYNNTITTETGTPAVLRLSEEEAWETNNFDPLDATWPAEDQIMNSFFWGNTLNENPVTSVSLQSDSDAEFIVENRDYFMHAPESSGGSESYTDRPGAAGNGADGTMEFSAEGANAYYPYTPYTYPHPMRSGPSNEGPFTSNLLMVLISQVQVMPIFWAWYGLICFVVIRLVNKS